MSQLQKRLSFARLWYFCQIRQTHIHRMSNISTLNCPPAVYWWRTTQTLVYGLPDLLSQKKNQLPFLKATIFLTSLVGLSWKRQLEHLLTKLPQNPTSAHIGPGKKTSAHMAAKPNVCCFSSLVLTDSFEHKMPGLHNFRIHQYQVFIWLSTNVVKYKFCNSEIFSS